MSILRDWIESRGVTQRELAEKIGLSQVMLNYLLQGRNTDIRISLAYRIHRATGLPIAAVIDDLLEQRERVKRLASQAVPAVVKAQPQAIQDLTEVTGSADDLAIEFGD